MTSVGNGSPVYSGTRCGVRIAGVGYAVPERVLSNSDLEQMVDTSDEWIVKRTGISERRIIDQERESTITLAREALQRALQDAELDPKELDLVILATVTAEMTCPSTACRIAAEIGAAPAAAFDLVAACSGFVYAMNLADSLIRSGRHRNVAVIGCDTMSSITDYSDRSLSILFGDAGGAAILTASDDESLGCMYQSMQSDASDWQTLYIPRKDRDVPEWDRDNPIRLGCLRMSGREVFRFAVTKFHDVIRDALTATELTADDIDQFICHQSNIRIIDAAKQKLGLPDDKVYINIDKFGNSSAGSVGLCLGQLWESGKVKPGDRICMVAFGGGLTWASGIWQL